jgi:hypothetical protein
MYIKFDLPTGAGGMVAQYTHSALSQNLQEWSEKYGGIPYNKKIHKWTVRVTFDDDKFYDFFALTWQPKSKQMLSYLLNYSLIEPMNRL